MLALVLASLLKTRLKGPIFKYPFSFENAFFFVFPCRPHVSDENGHREGNSHDVIVFQKFRFTGVHTRTRARKRRCQKFLLWKVFLTGCIFGCRLYRIREAGYAWKRENLVLFY